MLIVYKKATGEFIRHTGTNSSFPNGHDFEFEINHNILPKFGGTIEDYGEFRLHDDEESNKVNAILRAHKVDLVFDGDTPVDVVVYNKISVAADKKKIKADGADTATITASVTNPDQSDVRIELVFDGQVIDSKVCTNGNPVSFEITTTEVIKMNFIVRATDHGEKSIVIQGV